MAHADPHPLLETHHLSVRFGGHIAVHDVSCAFDKGSLTAIVGPNGAGKTTYFNLISGQLRATSGQVFLNGRDIAHLSASARTRAGIGRAFQLTNLFPRLNVLENVRLVVQAKARRGGDILSVAESDTSLIASAEGILKRVGLAAKADLPVDALSHGDQRKLEVALLLALDPAVMMFDEPTAGMSVDEAPAILDLIQSLKGDPTKAILLVEHKMDVIRTLADRIIVLHNGELVADGEPSDVMGLPIVREAYLGIDLDAVETVDG